MTVEALKRLSIDDRVEDALTSAEFAGASPELKTLAAEVIRLRECIENCKSVQSSSERIADDLRYRSALVNALQEHIDQWRAQETVVRVVYDELAKALEGF